ncbi:DNA/RNA non-specific endonuclease [Ferriphaselus sp. R-1]|uniref:DNA/RNA non-specific endonuclease n=1 Tax=Ferriphaselus sp. R-1 TaxID=1485544 RepID=UPI00054D5B4B|nr:DNA/RNA non-specific endonuclease [Ferriphaselus sp. R-1]
MSLVSKLLKHVVTASLLLPSVAVHAGSTSFDQCPQFFAHGKSPVIRASQQDMKPRALCFDGFAVLHSGSSHSPVYVAERLNRAMIEKDIERTDQFYAEARLPNSERAQLDDYRSSGYDRGHMAPAADMATDDAMAQSFSLANIVPQAPNNNRKTWAKLEKDTRKYVMRAQGDVYVISGPVYDTAPTTIGNTHVWVPRYLFKLVYDPSNHRAWAHWIENTDDARVGRPISYQELVQRTGIEFLPNLL